MNNEALIQRKALCLTHFLYRNTIIEDYHSDGTIMNLQLYEEIKEIIQKGLLQIELNSDILEDVFELKSTDKIAKHINNPIVQDVVFNMLMGTDWDAPELLPLSDFNTAEDYILGGKFLEFCRLHKKLSDTNMKILNKDIHSRIYTLIKNKSI